MIKEGTIINSVSIDNYWKEVNISKGRKKKYYSREDNIPQKYLNHWENYKFISGYLTDLNTGQRVIKNAISAGKPRVYTLSGQDIWSTMNFHLRSKISKELKKYFYAQISHLEPLEDEMYPIGIRLIFYDTIDGEDLDNQSIWYRKTITDALCGNVEYNKSETGQYIANRENYKQIIKDDSKEFVQSIPTEFYPIEDTEKRKLTIQIFKV